MGDKRPKQTLNPFFNQPVNFVDILPYKGRRTPLSPLHRGGVGVIFTGGVWERPFTGGLVGALHRGVARGTLDMGVKLGAFRMWGEIGVNSHGTGIGSS